MKRIEQSKSIFRLWGLAPSAKSIFWLEKNLSWNEFSIGAAS